MGRILALVACLATTLPSASNAAGKATRRQPPPPTARRVRAPQGLPAATIAMKALMRDRERRRYRHNWERAISGLLAAARGKEKVAAWMEASRARYALYRWSANEADRDKALILANRAAHAGSRGGRELAAAIRREAGDETAEAVRPARPARRAHAPAVASQERASTGTEESAAPADDSPPDPTLAAALADLNAPADGPALKLGEDQQQGPAEIGEVRTWASGDYSRVAVYLSHWVGWQKLELPSENGQPRRLAFDFRPATLSGKALTRAVAGAQIDRVRAAQNSGDTVRVVLDLPGSDVAQVFALDDPPRLVVDVGARPSAPAVAAPSAPPAPPEATSEEPATPGASRPGPAAHEEDGPRVVRRIVVDAGHGGHDPGAIGRGGLREKDVTLDMARRVAKQLQAEGFEVVLTRSTDRYLQLEERTALANTSRADLFVSIHANANPRRSQTGIESYFLNVTDDRYAVRLAARENGADLDGGESDDVARRIRADLDAVASAGTSKQLAVQVQRELCRTVRGRYGDVKDLGVKSALFYVLLGARMPAVLVETGFISNPSEEKRLASPAYRADVAQAIARAVRGFARPDDRVAAAR